MQQTSSPTAKETSKEDIGVAFLAPELEMHRKQLKILMMGPSLSQQGGMATVQNLIVQKVTNDVQIEHVATHEEGNIFFKTKIFCNAINKLLLSLLRNSCDLVHLHVSEKGSVLRISILVLVTRLFQKPVMIHTHGCEFHSFYDSLPLFLQMCVSWIFKQCVCVFVLSKSWQDYYVSQCGLSLERTFVLTNPVDFPEAIPDRSSAEKVTFLFLGRVGQRKGSFDLLQAFSNLPKEDQEKAALIIAGDGEVEKARDLVETLGIQSYVSIRGWLSQEKCKELLAQADVFILPSYNEGLPMAILEAMGWGLPIISTPVGGIPEIIVSGKTGLLVPPGNVQEIKAAIQFFIENKEQRVAWGIAARDCVAPLAIENYSLQLAKIYREAITSSEFVGVDCF
ncbi:glycosyltransferase family 4 protein [Leptolyngbyaceae cyanobacterium UHCC 1019]